MFIVHAWSARENLLVWSALLRGGFFYQHRATTDNSKCSTGFEVRGKKYFFIYQTAYTWRNPYQLQQCFP